MKKYKGFNGSGMNDNKLSNIAKRKNMTKVMREFLATKATERERQAIIAAEIISHIAEVSK